jgi:hypothetical protein
MGKRDAADVGFLEGVVPIAADGTWPVMATTGTESMYASAIGGDEVGRAGSGGRHADPDPAGGLRVPSAAWPAPCSCRTSTCRTAVESNRGRTPAGSPRRDAEHDVRPDRLERVDE